MTKELIKLKLSVTWKKTQTRGKWKEKMSRIFLNFLQPELKSSYLSTEAVCVVFLT